MRIIFIFTALLISSSLFSQEKSKNSSISQEKIELKKKQHLIDVREKQKENIKQLAVSKNENKVPKSATTRRLEIQKKIDYLEEKACCEKEINLLKATLKE